MISVNVKKDLHTAHGSVEAHFEIEIYKGEFLTLFGESGAGKTTLMRLIAGLEKPKSGKITVDGETWFDSAKKIDLPVQKRSVGFVFQDYALFPTMSVRENLLFAAENEMQRKSVDALIEMVELTSLSNRLPHSLSGGQKQRVALARALVREPKILLLDEPLSALDPSMRQKLQDELIAIHKKFGVTTLIVSHDIAETVKLSDRLASIEAGKILKVSKPIEFFTTQSLSGKLQFVAEILKIEEEFPIAVVTLLIGSSVVKTVITSQEVEEFAVGSKAIVASKAFNPILMPVKS
jgi:molybdate transport system ATP-binding protein